MRWGVRTAQFTRQAVVIAAALAWIVTCGATTRAGDPPVDLYDLVDETVLQSQVGDRVAMAWWIPEEFWISAFADEGPGADDLEDLVLVLRPYIVVAALEGEFDKSGELRISDPRKLRKSLQLKDARGSVYTPLGADKVSDEATLLAMSMKPALVELLGDLVSDLEFFYFPAVSREGIPIAEASGTGTFSVSVGDALFEWSLPLASALPPRRCVVDGRMINGSYIYCPWHGVRLADN
jgi:hypothetical protein